MLENRKAVIFDLDGTLVDSMWMWKEIDIEYLAKFGLECPDDLQKVIEGMSFSETAVYFKERFHIKDSLDEIKQDWIRMSLNKYKYEVTLKPGVKEFLDWADGRGMAMGIATSNGKDMVFAIEDRGEGMDEATCDKIFDKFYQGDTSHATEGNGLGLSLVRKIVELHHGSIKVKSQPGRGSIFVVMLPLEG